MGRYFVWIQNPKIAPVTGLVVDQPMFFSSTHSIGASFLKVPKRNKRGTEDLCNFEGIYCRCVLKLKGCRCARYPFGVDLKAPNLGEFSVIF